jgi:hypothetical protein
MKFASLVAALTIGLLCGLTVNTAVNAQRVTDKNTVDRQKAIDDFTDGRATTKVDSPLVPTQAQLYRMQAAQQAFFRWQDKVNESLQAFYAACQAAQNENKWPDVVCHIENLTITLKDQPPQPAAKPEAPAK